MKRKLASVQVIKKIESIPNAERIELATVLGWHLVIAKDKYQVGDKVVYFETDSCVPHTDVYSDLERTGYRVKTQKFMGQISQGYCMGIQALGLDENLDVDTDVTDLLGVTKYELPDEYNCAPYIIGYRPDYIHQSGEMRVQTLEEMVNVYAGHRCVVTEKMDGTSSSFCVVDGEYKIFSHNSEVKVDGGSCYADVSIKLDIEKKLRTLNHNYALMGEICGPGICKNRYQFKEYEFFAFDIWDIDTHSMLPYKEFIRICDLLGVRTVFCLNDNYILPNNIDDLVEYSKGISLVRNIKREGIVIRLYDDAPDFDYIKFGMDRFSFKVINPEYSLKRGN